MKHILVASLGGAPQVITEALWALMNPERLIDPAHRGRASVAPEEVHILATSLSWPFGSVAERDATITAKIHELYRQHGRPLPKIDIEKLMDSGIAIPDVRTQRQNIIYANAVAKVVAQLADEQTIIHMLLAGGRKSMSSYDQSAMMFFGRIGDELVHALVEPDALERCRDFWWPGQEAKVVMTPQGDKFSTDPEFARVDLVNVPFVRLGVRLPDGVPMEAVDHEKLVEFVQFEQSREPVTINLSDCSITVGQQKVTITATNFIMFATLAVIRKANWRGVGPKDEGIGGNAGGWIMLDDLRYALNGSGKSKNSKALKLAATLRDTVLKDIADQRIAREDSSDSQADWVARAERTIQGGEDHITVVKSRCAKQLRSRIENPFIAGRISPDYYGRAATQAIGLPLPASRIELRGFEKFSSWLV